MGLTCSPLRACMHCSDVLFVISRAANEAVLSITFNTFLNKSMGRELLFYIIYSPTLFSTFRNHKLIDKMSAAKIIIINK